MPNGLGVDIKTHQSERSDAYLFGEGQGRIVITVDEKNLPAIKAEIDSDGVHYSVIGEVSGIDMIVDDEDFGSVSEFSDIYENAIERQLQVGKFA